MNIELFKTNVKRNPTILFIIFSVITLGIYIFYWIFSRKNSLNLISETKLNNAVVIIYFISAIGSYLGSYLGPNQGGFISQDSYLIDFSNLLGFVSFISGIVISFKMKDILKEFSDNNEMIISYNWFLTFFLNIMYINYKINENIDYIAQNSIVDKEETPTSDKETTSEKTPESPEDRLQKLADVKEKGLINEDEFNSKKEEILKEM